MAKAEALAGALGSLKVSLGRLTLRKIREAPSPFKPFGWPAGSD